MTDTVLDIQVLQASVDPEDQSEFRILVNRKIVKYLTIDPGLYDVDDMCFGPSLTSMIPSLPAVTHLWHPLQVDHLELHLGRKLRSNFYEATCPRFNSTIIAKFARFAWEIPQLDAETSAYQWIENAQIGPKFLGHISEEGRIVGFIVERISSCHHATPEDLALCQQTLLRLHKLRIKHGDINKHNFLMHDKNATLIDFDHATQNNDANTLGEEFRMLQAELEETSGRGGRIVEINGW
ncbi:alpha-galactosidase A precursor [Pyrenochaeta sp. MPI-SDFR-AT-0127]|nr:alpha-galactosidase A precursor [Pyrenochaeta sp. MPI-SDFR-AT-0127]